MHKSLRVSLQSKEWRMVDEDHVGDHFSVLGFSSLDELMKLRMFDFLNLQSNDNYRAEEMLMCIYRFLYPDNSVDEAMYYGEIRQHFPYRSWRRKHKNLSEVTLADLLLPAGINEKAMQHLFDVVTVAFYKSEEYDSRQYRYASLQELRRSSCST